MLVNIFKIKINANELLFILNKKKTVLRTERNLIAFN